MAVILTLSAINLAMATEPRGDVPGPDRQAVVLALRHREGLVKTLRVGYYHTVRPTSSEQATLIRRVLGKKAEPYIYSPEFAQRNSITAQLWRKGAKQRDEWYSPTAPAIADRQRTFDGQVLRSVRQQGTDDQVFAAIASAATGDWYTMPREDPMAFVYLWYDQPISEVVGLAARFSSSVVMRGQQRFFRVSLDGSIKGGNLELLFDERFLPQERVLKIPSDKDRNRYVLNHKLEFSDYREYETPSGETIYFPDLVKYIGYFEAPDGNSVEAFWKETQSTKVEFNVEMPDSLFELEIPKNAVINDLLTGTGWTPRQKLPAVRLIPEPSTRRLVVRTIISATLLLIAIAVFYKRWRSSVGRGA